MRDRFNNPISASSTQQQTWSFDGFNDAHPALSRQPNPFHSRHRTTANDQPSVDPLPPLQIERRRPLIPNDESGPAWHNPSARRSSLQDPNSSRQARWYSNINITPAQREAVLRNRREPIPYALGTREEVQSDDYVSPVAAMFGRAWNRYRGAEEQRATLRSEIANGAESPADPSLNLLGTHPPQWEFEAIMNERRRVSEQERREQLRQMLANHEAAQDPSFHSEENPIDVQASRPPPLENDEMTANIACRVCHEQKIDTLLEPCMHLAMCRWCTEVLQERTRRYRENSSNPLYTSLHPQDDRLRCPICRRNVAQARRVFLAL